MSTAHENDQQGGGQSRAGSCQRQAGQEIGGAQDGTARRGQTGAQILPGLLGSGHRHTAGGAQQADRLSIRLRLRLAFGTVLKVTLDLRRLGFGEPLGGIVPETIGNFIAFAFKPHYS